MKNTVVNPQLARLLAKFSRVLPPRLSAALYYRFLAKFNMGAALYSETPLTFAPGFKMNLMRGDTSHGSIVFTGCYELALSRRIHEIGHKLGGTMIDAGANYGYFSLIWAAAQPDNRVIVAAQHRDQRIALEHRRRIGIGHIGIAAGQFRA